MKVYIVVRPPDSWGDIGVYHICGVFLNKGLADALAKTESLKEECPGLYEVQEHEVQ